MPMIYGCGEQLYQRMRAQRDSMIKRRAFNELHDPRRYSESDYAVRIRNGHYESFNKQNGSVLYSYPLEAFAEQEALNDIRDHFQNGD